MPEYLEVTLDVATALSIIGAAATFFFQLRRQKRADLEVEKWQLLKEMAGRINDYKTEIVYAIMEKHDRIMESKEVGFKEETWAETEWKDLVLLLNHVLEILTKAYYFAEQDLRSNAQMIAVQFKDPRMDITEQVESFRAGVELINDRLTKMMMIPAVMDWKLRMFYVHYFLREVGLRILGQDVTKWSFGEKPDDYLDQVMSLTETYAPREYYKKEEQPPTVFDVLDDFANSIVEAIRV